MPSFRSKFTGFLKYFGPKASEETGSGKCGLPTDVLSELERQKITVSEAETPDPDPSAEHPVFWCILTHIYQPPSQSNDGDCGAKIAGAGDFQRTGLGGELYTLTEQEGEKGDCDDCPPVPYTGKCKPLKAITDELGQKIIGYRDETPDEIARKVPADAYGPGGICYAGRFIKHVYQVKNTTAAFTKNFNNSNLIDKNKCQYLSVPNQDITDFNFSDNLTEVTEVISDDNQLFQNGQVTFRPSTAGIHDLVASFLDNAKIRMKINISELLLKLIDPVNASWDSDDEITINPYEAKKINLQRTMRSDFGHGVEEKFIGSNDFMNGNFNVNNHRNGEIGKVKVTISPVENETLPTDVLLIDLGAGNDVNNEKNKRYHLNGSVPDNGTHTNLYRPLETMGENNYTNKEYKKYGFLRDDGHYHMGIDINAQENAPVKAIADGDIVGYTDFSGGTKMIIAKHKIDNQDYYVGYGEVKSDSLSTSGITGAPSQNNPIHVSRGQIIGRVGFTNVTSGERMLHFELYSQYPGSENWTINTPRPSWVLDPTALANRIYQGNSSDIIATYNQQVNFAVKTNKAGKFKLTFSDASDTSTPFEPVSMQVKVNPQNHNYTLNTTLKEKSTDGSWQVVASGETYNDGEYKIEGQLITANQTTDADFPADDLEGIPVQISKESGQGEIIANNEAGTMLSNDGYTVTTDENGNFSYEFKNKTIGNMAVRISTQDPNSANQSTAQINLNIIGATLTFSTCTATLEPLDSLELEQNPSISLNPKPSLDSLISQLLPYHVLAEDNNNSPVYYQLRPNTCHTTPAINTSRLLDPRNRLANGNISLLDPQPQLPNRVNLDYAIKYDIKTIIENMDNAVIRSGDYIIEIYVEDENAARQLLRVIDISGMLINAYPIMRGGKVEITILNTTALGGVLTLKINGTVMSPDGNIGPRLNGIFATLRWGDNRQPSRVILRVNYNGNHYDRSIPMPQLPSGESNNPVPPSSSLNTPLDPSSYRNDDSIIGNVALEETISNQELSITYDPTNYVLPDQNISAKDGSSIAIPDPQQENSNVFVTAMGSDDVLIFNNIEYTNDLRQDRNIRHLTINTSFSPSDNPHNQQELIAQAKQDLNLMKLDDFCDPDLVDCSQYTNNDKIYPQAPKLDKDISQASWNEKIDYRQNYLQYIKEFNQKLLAEEEYINDQFADNSLRTAERVSSKKTFYKKLVNQNQQDANNKINKFVFIDSIINSANKLYEGSKEKIKKLFGISQAEAADNGLTMQVSDSTDNEKASYTTGQYLKLEVSNLKNSERYEIYLDDQFIAEGKKIADDFSFEVYISKDTKKGSHKLVFIGNSAGEQLEKSIAIEASKAKIPMVYYITGATILLGSITILFIFRVRSHKKAS